MYLKQRLFALLIIVICGSLTWYNWYQVAHEGTYYPKVAVFGPVGIVGGVFLLLFPSMAGKAATTKQKLLVFLVFAVGIVAGIVNLYLMNPGFFGR